MDDDGQAGRRRISRSVTGGFETNSPSFCHFLDPSRPGARVDDSSPPYAVCSERDSRTQGIAPLPFAFGSSIPFGRGAYVHLSLSSVLLSTTITNFWCNGTLEGRNPSSFFVFFSLDTLRKSARQGKRQPGPSTHQVQVLGL